jgi:hypothetical protein
MCSTLELFLQDLPEITNCGGGGHDVESAELASLVLAQIATLHSVRNAAFCVRIVSSYNQLVYMSDCHSIIHIRILLE